MKLNIREKIKDSLIMISFFTVLCSFVLGFEKILSLIPLLSIDTRISIAVGISFLLLILAGLKYEKMQNEIYKWKNKDKIKNIYNDHMFKNDENEQQMITDTNKLK